MGPGDRQNLAASRFSASITSTQPATISNDIVEICPTFWESRECDLRALSLRSGTFISFDGSYRQLQPPRVLGVERHNIYRFYSNRIGASQWIYNLKVTQKVGETTIEGFCGGTFMGNPFNDVFLPSGTPPSTPTSVHLAMTYCALLTLLTLGDDLSHVNAQDIMEGVKGLQNLDREGDGILYGSFKSHCEG